MNTRRHRRLITFRCIIAKMGRRDSLWLPIHSAVSGHLCHQLRTVHSLYVKWMYEVLEIKKKMH